MKFTTTERAVLTCVSCGGSTVIAPDNTYDTNDLTCNCHIAKLEESNVIITAGMINAPVDTDTDVVLAVGDMSYADIKTTAFEAGYTPAKGNPKRIDLEEFLINLPDEG